MPSRPTNIYCSFLYRIDKIFCYIYSTYISNCSQTLSDWLYGCSIVHQSIPYWYNFVLTVLDLLVILFINSTQLAWFCACSIVYQTLPVWHHFTLFTFGLSVKEFIKVYPIDKFLCVLFNKIFFEFAISFDQTTPNLL